MQVPLIDLKAQYESIKDELQGAVGDVLSQGAYVLGPEVKKFEEEIARYCDTRFAVGVGCGTDALEIALRALEVGPGDEVIVPAFSFYATSLAVALVGATIVCVDVDPLTYTLSPEAFESAITSKTKAVIPVHIFGHPCDMDSILSIAEKHSIAVIEDCAQAIGASYKDRRIGSFGNLAAFSFYPTKNLGAAGDGGMILSQDEKLADRIRALRDYGSFDRESFPLLGRNSRLDSLQAAILRVKLKHLDEWNESRHQHVEEYRRRVEAAGIDEYIRLPFERSDSRCVWHLFPVRTPHRDDLRMRLIEEGIGSQVHYPYALHEPQATKPFLKTAGPFPVAEGLAREVLSLPMFPEMSSAQIEAVVKALGKIVADQTSFH